MFLCGMYLRNFKNNKNSGLGCACGAVFWYDIFEEVRFTGPYLSFLTNRCADKMALSRQYQLALFKYISLSLNSRLIIYTVTDTARQKLI